MAKKKAVRKKAAKKSKALNSRPSKTAKPRRPARGPRKTTPPRPTGQNWEYGPAFFLTAANEKAAAYEIDGTPHDKTIHSYRLEQAAIKEFEEQDGKILYKVNRLKSPAG